MADSVYNTGKGDIDSSDLRVLLVKSTYTFSADHEDVADVVANECDFTNYGRKALTTEAEAYDNANDRWTLDADDPAVWSSAGGATNNTIGGMIVYAYNAVDADAKLYTYHDTGFPITTNGGNLTVTFSTSPSAIMTST